MLREPSARFDLALIQIKPISSLNRAFRLFMMQGLLSKISPFLEVQIVQQVMMTISLKMGLSNAVLASMIISRGGRFMFQIIPRWVQQSRLNGRSKKRCMQVSSFPKLHIAQEYPAKFCFSFIADFYFWYSNGP